MVKGISLFLLVCLLFGCKSGQPEVFGQAAPLKASSSDMVEAFLPPATFESLNNIEKVSLFRIELSLISGTTDEYSNKSTFDRELSQSEVDSFLALLKSDTSYKWKEYSDEIPFKADKNYVFKTSDGQFNVLTNSERKLISFISLDGQKLIPINAEFSDFLEKVK
jgi:hypothetical protein